jgi:hypothetical protein
MIRETSLEVAMYGDGYCQDGDFEERGRIMSEGSSAGKISYSESHLPTMT